MEELARGIAEQPTGGRLVAWQHLSRGQPVDPESLNANFSADTVCPLGVDSNLPGQHWELLELLDRLWLSLFLLPRTCCRLAMTKLLWPHL